MRDNVTGLFEKYLALLLSANEQFNLTAVRDPDEIRARHFEDSLRLLEAADFEGRSVIDVGSGAGFPGLALRIARPDIKLTLLDATEKKVGFLRDVCRELGLSDVRCLHGRAEDLAHTELRESFDIVTARGVASLPALAELCLPLARVGGLFLAMKETAQAWPGVVAFGGRNLEPYVYTLSNGMAHAVVRVLKEKPAPRQYPRAWAQIRRAAERETRA